MIPIPILTTFVAGLQTSGRYLGGSATSFMIAAVIPEEESLIKAASAITGWALAVVCIWTLAKAVRFLYTKIEEKDVLIAKLHFDAEAKADKQRQDMLDELKSINAKSRE
jgi:hypothetical protein